MKKLTSLLLVSVLAGAITLGSYKLFFEKPLAPPTKITAQEHLQRAKTTFVSNHSTHPISSTNADFTEAANKTVHAVVHIKNVLIGHSPRTLSEYMQGMRGGKAVRGSGSGVIISPDGYIVTNNHVIEGANELEVTLNNNLTYKAEVIGTDPEGDIALLKIDAKDLNYIPFGNSDNVKIGEWVLAVGNPFNLTSTVTAGIISAKGRNLNEHSAQMQSFIQTDAAINPGNSGGALVNIKGQLIGINDAIFSQTGSYIGYGFAVPSNNAKKIVQDIMEYGDVQRAILGISGKTIDPENAKKNDLAISQGVYVDSVSEGAEKAGLQKGDFITKVDGLRVRKLSDLVAYIGTKRPKETVQVNYMRNAHERTAQVTLTKYVSYPLQAAGVEVIDASKKYLNKFDSQHGVRISRSLSKDFKIPRDKYIILAIDGKYVDSVKDVKNIMSSKRPGENTKITFKDNNGNEESYVFQP